MNDLLSLVIGKIESIIVEKGAEPTSIEGSTQLLGGEIPIDSLELARLVAELEDETGKDPFVDGFREFTTVGELVSLSQ